jgi:NTE family protein
LRASFALPGLFPPIELDKRWLADGALVDPLPVAACRALGADLVIAVNLNTDIIGKARRSRSGASAFMGFDPGALLEESAQAPSPLFADSMTLGVFRRESNKPNVFDVMTTSLSIMQDRLTRSRLAGDPPDVQITPRVGHIGLLEFERAEELIREGEEAVERRGPELMDAMQAIGFASTS